MPRATGVSVLTIQRHLRFGSFAFFAAPFLLAAGLELVSPSGASPILVTMGVWLAFAGIGLLTSGIQTNIEFNARLGLTILGGFAAAMLILIANMVLKVFLAVS